MNKHRCFTYSIILILIISNSYQVLSSKIDVEENTDKKWAVFISVGEPELDLRNVHDLKEILLNNGWYEDNILCYNEDGATKEAILKAPQLLVNKGLEKDDLVLFYFSMHGGKTNDVAPLDEPDGIDEFIIPYKIDEGNFSENILDEELASAMECLNSDQVILIFEVCYSGGMIDGSADLKKSGRIVMTSADTNETSYPIFLRKTWLFPFYLIKGLKGPADFNKDSFISAEEAFVYARKRTVFRSAIYGCLLYIFHKSLFIQHPQIYDGWPSDENNSDELMLVNLQHS